MSRKNAILRIVAILYFPIAAAIGYPLGLILSLLFLIPSLLWQILTGNDPSDREEETVRRRLVLWPERVRTFALTGEGEMKWTP